MDIAYVASEAAPFIKTGGLADVVGALPVAMRILGHNPIIILPKYAAVGTQEFNLRPFMDQLGVWMGDGLEWSSVYHTKYKTFRSILLSRINILIAGGSIMMLNSMTTWITRGALDSSHARRCNYAAIWVSRPISCMHMIG